MLDMINSSSSFHPENYPAGSTTRTTPNLSKKARFFANMVALLWFYYGIGTWYGSRFVFNEELRGPEPGVILGATFAVWFISYFSSVAYFLLKKKE